MIETLASGNVIETLASGNRIDLLPEHLIAQLPEDPSAAAWREEGWDVPATGGMPGMPAIGGSQKAWRFIRDLCLRHRGEVREALDVVPVLAPGSDGSDALSLFGYGSDGAMVNSTILCALVALVRAGPWRQNSGEWHAQAEVQADEALCTRDALLEFHKG